MQEVRACGATKGFPSFRNLDVAHAAARFGEKGVMHLAAFPLGNPRPHTYEFFSSSGA
jgi:hypothetical protein